METVEGRDGFIRRAAQRRLERVAARALAMGAISQEEYDEMMAKVGAFDIWMIMEIIMMILEAIREWRANRT